MNAVLFACSLIFLYAISLFLTRIYKIDGVLRSLLAFFLFLVSTLVLSLLVAGYLLQKLTPLAVLTVQAVLTFCVLAFVEKSRFNPLPKRWLASIASEISDIVHAPWVLAFLLLGLAEVLWILVLVYLFPVFDMDGLVYHMVSAAGWIQDGRIHELPYHIWSNVYPHNTELVSTWLLLFLKSDTFIDGLQLIFCFGGMLATAGIAKHIGLSKVNAVISGMLFLLTPIVLVQCRTTYIDVAFASMFLISFYFLLRFESERKMVDLFLSALAAGFTLGMKYSALPYTGMVLLILILILLRELLGRRIGSSGFLQGIVLILLPVFVLGTVWYMRNWVLYGNPFHPFTITLLGHELFHGIGTPQEVLYNNANTPEQLRNIPYWKQIWTSWISEPEVTVYDQRLGGLGLQWILLEFPAIIILGVYGLFKQRKYVWMMLIPLALIFAVQPQNWWSRYTIFIVAPGAIALVFLIEQISMVAVRSVLHFVMFVAVLASMYFSATQAMFPPERVLQVLRMSSDERTLGGVFDPRYRWVDGMQEGTTIAFTNDMPYLYTLFGSRLQNKPVMIEENRQESFIRKLVDSKARYFFTHEGSPQDQWARNHAEMFRLCDSTSTGRVYQVSVSRNIIPLPVK